MAKTKFDTNPLDPEFPKKVAEQQQEPSPETQTLPYSGGETQKFAPASVTEQETRRFNEQNFDAYQSPYNGQQIPAQYKTAHFQTNVGRTTSRKVDKVGMPENVLTALPYLPFTIGLVAGLLELIFVPKSEQKVRFHAAQGLAAHIGILIVSTILNFVDNFTGLADVANGIFWLVTTIMLIIFSVKAFRGKPVHIESVDDLTNWLEDKISPRK